MANILIGQLAAEITNTLEAYADDVVEAIDISSVKVGKAAVKRLKQTSPKESGNYAKSWAIKSEEYFTGQPKNRIIHVKKPHYRLTHLLEHGHAKAGGGRVSGKPHIRPAEEEVIREFAREVEEAIRNGAR